MSEEKLTEEVGAEEVTEEPEEEIPVTSTEDTSKIKKGAYKPLQFEVKDVKKNVPDMPDVSNEEKQAKENLFTKEDARFFGQIIWNIPEGIWGDYMAVDEKLINQWSDQLYSYCERKGINLYDYVFAEFGLIMSTAVIVTSLATKYRAHKKEEKEKEEEEESES